MIFSKSSGKLSKLVSRQPEASQKHEEEEKVRSHDLIPIQVPRHVLEHPPTTTVRDMKSSPVTSKLV